MYSHNLVIAVVKWCHLNFSTRRYLTISSERIRQNSKYPLPASINPTRPYPCTPRIAHPARESRKHPRFRRTTKTTPPVSPVRSVSHSNQRGGWIFPLYAGKVGWIPTPAPRPLHRFQFRSLPSATPRRPFSAESSPDDPCGPPDISPVPPPPSGASHPSASSGCRFPCFHPLPAPHPLVCRIPATMSTERHATPNGGRRLKNAATLPQLRALVSRFALILNVVAGAGWVYFCKAWWWVGVVKMG